MRLNRSLVYISLLISCSLQAQESGTGAPLTQREREMLDRIERLEQRLASLESAGSTLSPPSTSPGQKTSPESKQSLTPSSPESIPQPVAESKPAGSFVPAVKVYGRVELDAIYSSRGTNPLDPRQFNGYSTAAGPENQSSATFNPRFSVIGIEANSHKGNQTLDAKVEADFYSTDAASLFTPRLRLAYIQYTNQNTKATFGMDWLPVASLLPSLMDFSIMGYSGNLWQRIPR